MLGLLRLLLLHALLLGLQGLPLLQGLLLQGGLLLLLLLLAL